MRSICFLRLWFCSFFFPARWKSWLLWKNKEPPITQSPFSLSFFLMFYLGEKFKNQTNPGWLLGCGWKAEYFHHGKKSISWLASTYRQTILAEDSDTRAKREINDLFFLCRSYRIWQEWKRSPAGGKIPSFLFLDLVFLVIAVVSCIISLIYSLKIGCYYMLNIVPVGSVSEQLPFNGVL